MSVMKSLALKLPPVKKLYQQRDDLFQENNNLQWKLNACLREKEETEKWAVEVNAHNKRLEQIISDQYQDMQKTILDQQKEMQQTLLNQERQMQQTLFDQKTDLEQKIIDREAQVDQLHQAVTAREQELQNCALELEKRGYFSSHGEDVILRNIFFNTFKKHVREKGFFVDIGAHHPSYMSNTYWFYNKGWRGINVEANPYALEAFNRDRPEDKNLNYAVAQEDGFADFYLFGDSNSEDYGTSSTISSNFKDYVVSTQHVQVNETIKVPAIRMDTLFKIYCEGRDIDFLNLDIEGFELQALTTNDWEKYRPFIIAVEILPQGKDFNNEFTNNPIVQYLYEQRYKLFSYTLYTWFFYDIQSENKEFVECWMGFGEEN